MADDKKNLPTRKGPWIGRGNERQMMVETGIDGFRKSYRTNADGSKTMLKTRGGFPQFTTTEPDTDTVGLIQRGVFQCLMANPEREKYVDFETAAAYKKITGTWQDWFRPAVDGFSPREKNKWYFLESSEKIVSNADARYYKLETSKGAIDWFKQTGTYDEAQPTLTWGILPGGRNAEANGYGRSGEYPPLEGYTRKHALFTDDKAAGLFMDGKLVSNTTDMQIRCAGIHEGKIRIVTGFSNNGYYTPGGVPTWEPLTQLDCYEQGDTVGQWDHIATLDQPWYMRHQLSFNPDATKIVGIVSDYGDDGYPAVVELDFATLTPTFSHQSVRKSHIDDITPGAGFSSSSAPGGGEPYMESYHRHASPESNYERGYHELSFPMSAEYNSAGEIEVLTSEYVYSYLRLGAPNDVAGKLVSSTHIGWETLDLSSAFDSNKAIISAIVWGSGLSLDPSMIDGQAMGPLKTAGKTAVGIVDDYIAMFEILITPSDTTLARASKGYDKRYVVDGVDQRISSGIRHSNGEYRQTSGSRLYRPMQAFTIRNGGAPTISVISSEVTVTGPGDGESAVVTLSAIDVTWSYYEDEAPDPLEATTESVVDDSLIQCDLRHDVYAFLDDDENVRVTFGSLDDDIGAPPAWWALPGHNPSGAVDSSEYRGDPSIPVSFDRNGTGWMTVDQSGQHVVFQKNIPTFDPDGNVWPKMIYATPSGQVEISPEIPGAIHVAPIFYANKKHPV